MTVSLRTKRVGVYAYSDTGSGGLVAHTYTKVPSAASDGNWWASRGVPTGKEALVAQQSEHVADAVFGFDSDVPITPDGLIVDVALGEAFKVIAVLARDTSTGEWQVLAEFNTDAVYTEVGA